MDRVVAAGERLVDRDEFEPDELETSRFEPPEDHADQAALRRSGLTMAGVCVPCLPLASFRGGRFGEPYELNG